MKKIITLSIAVVAIAMIAVMFYGCGNNADDMTTTTPTTDITPDTTMDIVTVPDMSDGMVSDVSGEGNDGLVGDIVDGVSEGVSEGITDIKNAITE